jgi:cbb3-type cytochrome oxidase subunit 1
MAKNFLKIAAIYFTVGVILGLVMGIIHDFRLASVHAHFNLLGWVSMALFGVLYHLYPQAADTKLAKTHFWLYNIGVPVMQVSIALQILTENMVFLPFAIVSSILVVVGVILFTINLFTQLSASSAQAKNRSVKF